MSSPFDVAAAPLRVIVADDDPAVASALDEALRRDGQSVECFPGLEAALAVGGDADAVIAGVRLDGLSGPELLGLVKARWPRAEVVLTCDVAFLPAAADALRAGAFAYLVRPLGELDGPVRIVRRAAERRRLVDRLGELQRVLADRGEAELGALADLGYAEARRLAIRAFERRYLSAVLGRADGNITAAARAAGMDRSNFRRALKASGLRAPKAPPGSEDRS